MTKDQLIAIRELSNEQLIADIDFYEKKEAKIPKMMKEVRISSAKRVRAHIAELQARIQDNRIGG